MTPAIWCGAGCFPQPREVIKSLRGITPVEMRNARRCCGGGGSISFCSYKLSKDVSRRKMENIELTGA